ncbi:MAG TPA: hypothetical protein VGP06_05890 [Janthinobacterium sp.]|jgi:hypothetical protein|nr:hypothetical protein [Janthinobacterium sp.]
MSAAGNFFFDLHPIIYIILTFLSCLPFALLFNITKWIEELYYDPDTRRAQAGSDAERYVQKLLSQHQSRYPESQIRHNTLFCF